MQSQSNKIQTLKTDIICSNCGNENMMRRDYKEGRILCEGCGFIAEKGFIDHTAEYRIFSEGNSGSDPRRTGGIYNENLDSGGCGTKIDNQKDKGLYYQEKSLITLDERKLNIGTRKLRDWGHGLNVKENILNTSTTNFEKLLKETRLAGKPLEVMLATILFLAAKMENNPISITALENHTSVKKEDIRKCTMKIRKYIPNLTYTSAAIFAESFGGKLGLHQRVIEDAKDFAKRIEENYIFEGKNPRNIAGLVLFIVTNYGEDNKKSLQDIAKVSNIAEATIKNTGKLLIQKLDLLGYGGDKKKKIENILNIKIE